MPLCNCVTIQTSNATRKKLDCIIYICKYIGMKTNKHIESVHHLHKTTITIQKLFTHDLSFYVSNLPIFRNLVFFVPSKQHVLCFFLAGYQLSKQLSGSTTFCGSQVYVALTHRFGRSNLAERVATEHFKIQVGEITKKKHL